MFVKGTLKKASILLTLSVMPFLLGYIYISFLLFSAIVFLMQFFRDPNRDIPSDEGVVVAPADGRFFKGKIDRIEVVNSTQHIMGEILENGETGIRISTFMSPFDVHVNRSPLSGKIVKTKYYPGKFKLAWKHMETENEKNLIVIDTPYGHIGVIQIAGFVARRIVQYVNVGDEVKIGSRLGMIKFGSRVDLIIPQKNFEVMVDIGGRPKAGVTVMAKFLGLENDISSLE